jgi:hypothetical protein
MEVCRSVLLWHRYFGGWHCLLTPVFHDQANDIREQVMRYEQALSRAGLPNIPFRSEPLLNGHGTYEGLEPSQRKQLLWSFNVLVQRLPISYATFWLFDVSSG